MNKLAAKALGMFGEEKEEEGNPFKSDSDSYSEDLEMEMQAFLDAAAKKDTSGMAEAFREAMRLCK